MYVDKINNLRNQLKGKEKVDKDSSYVDKNSHLINNLKDLFTHIAIGQQIKYLDIQSFIGKYLVQVMKESISISHYNSFLTIANKVLENSFPLFIEIGHDIKGIYLEHHFKHNFSKLSLSTNKIHSNFYPSKLGTLLFEAC